MIACDLSERIDEYARTHHMQVKADLDLALREFYAARGDTDGEGVR